MSEPSRTSNLPTAAFLCVAALVLWTAPQWIVDAFRNGVRDAILPGQLLANKAVEPVHTVFYRIAGREDLMAEIAALKSKVDVGWFRTRQLQAENLMLTERLAQFQRQGPAPYRGTPGEPLLVPELLEAKVLGEEAATLWRGGKLLDLGETAGVLESSLVLEDLNPLIGQGKDAGVSTGQPVYSARSVVGRIALVGHWSSTMQLVTDRNYRGRARLARQTSQGMVFGAPGIFVGEGQPLCRLQRVSSTVAVNVGDDVFTDSRTSVFPDPLYYGRVVKVEQKPGAPFWEIWVEPDIKDRKLQMRGVKFQQQVDLPVSVVPSMAKHV